MSSTAKAAANSANSKLSTGPTSDAGKAASSQNARKLGFAGKTFHLLTVEDQENFNEYLNGLTAEYQPATVMELTLVTKIAQHYWLSQRALFLQEFCFGDNMETINHPDARKQLPLYLRYQSTHDRAFHKCRQELEKMQAARKAEPVKQETAAVRLEISQLKLERERMRPPQPAKASRIARPASVVAEIPSATAVPVAA